MISIRLTLIASLSSLLMLPSFAACTPITNRQVVLPQTKAELSNPQSLTGIAGEVDQIAQKVTVLINSRSSGNGSGVIVAKQGNNYYVLTANHVVSRPDQYEIVAADGQQYQVDAKTIKQFEGVDLALVSFSSSQSYSVATLANYEIGLEDRMLVFVSGFPGVKADAKSTPTRKFTGGTVASSEISAILAQNAYSLVNGYELVYTSLSQPGMSGGPVFDRLGRVVGINAATEGELTINDKGQETEIHLGRSLGVPMKTFIGLTPQAGLNSTLLKVETNVPPVQNQSEVDKILQDMFSESAPSGDASAADYLNYGNQLWRVRKYNESVAAFDRAIQLDANFYQAYYAKGLALYSQEKYQEAATQFDRATQIEPNIYEFWRMKAQTLDQMKKSSEALTSIDRAIELKPDDYVLYIQRGFIQINLERYSEAETAYTKAIELKPQNFYGYFFRGLTRYNLKKYPGALEDFGKSVELQPNHYSSYTTRGLIYVTMGNAQAGLADLNKAIELAPAGNPLVLEAYKARGVTRMISGDLQGAIADCTKVVEGKPENKRLLREGYECLAQTSANSRDFQGAIANQTKAIELDPNNAVAYQYRGGFRNQAQDYQGALTDFNKAIELDPNNADAYQNRATSRLGLNDAQGAMADYQKAVALYTQKIASDPNNVQHYINRAISNLGAGNKQAALQDVKKAEQLLQQQGVTSGVGYNLVQKLKTFIQSN
jgi:tetratricopeptide (TPR) repeat protein